jgi:predicted GNAT family N-acyltransferase
VIGKFNGRVIASCRLAFSSYDDQMEQEQYVSWPSNLPRRDECVEMMRLCTDPDFRGSDIIVAMFQFMALAIVQSKRRWVVICATEDMLKFYQKIGFVLTNLSYPHKKLNGKIHYIMYADVARGMVGFGMGPIFWNIIWRDVCEYMIDFQLLVPDPLANMRVALYRMLSPIANFLARRYRSPRRMARQK